MEKVNRYAKAIVSALVAGYALYQSSRPGGVDVNEWVDIIFAALAAGGVVYAVPNAPAKRARPSDDSN